MLLLKVVFGLQALWPLGFSTVEVHADALTLDYSIFFQAAWQIAHGHLDPVLPVGPVGLASPWSPVAWITLLADGLHSGTSFARPIIHQSLPVWRFTVVGTVWALAWLARRAGIGLVALPIVVATSVGSPSPGCRATPPTGCGYRRPPRPCSGAGTAAVTRAALVAPPATARWPRRPGSRSSPGTSHPGSAVSLPFPDRFQPAAAGPVTARLGRFHAWWVSRRSATRPAPPLPRSPPGLIGSLGYAPRAVLLRA